MTSDTLTCDARRRLGVEGGCFLAGCLLVLLACGGTNGASRGPEAPGAADPRLAACDGGDSVTCNQVGEELWEQQAYAEARDWFRASCTRMDLVAHGQRLAELGAQAQSDDLQRMDSVKTEGDELKARIEGCVRVGDTHHMQGQHSAAMPYFEKVCKLQAIQPQAEPLIPDLHTLVESACDASQFSRQAAAVDAARSAEVHGVLVSAEAATPAPMQSPRCFDLGRSCETDPSVLQWKQQCSPHLPTQAPCYCAAAAAYECLITHGCYAEAGARRADGQPSDTRLATLQHGVEQNAAGAERLGMPCP